jgi:hypothetical protein
MGNGLSGPNKRGGGSDLARAAEYLLLEVSDCLWELTPAWLAARWLRWRQARLRRREAALRAATNHDQSTAPWKALEAAYAALDHRRESLRQRPRDWVEQTMLVLMVIQITWGAFRSLFAWLEAIDAVRQAFSLAVAVEP